jgi:hypothetical protein
MSISSTHIIFLTYFIYIIDISSAISITCSLLLRFQILYLLILVSFTGEATSDGGKKNRYASC